MSLMISSAMLVGCNSKQTTNTNNIEQTKTNITTTTENKNEIETTNKEEKTVETTEPEIQETSNNQIINYDNMQFSVNNHTYTLGKSTLQDMINAGCPFDEDDIANANNNLNKNTKSQGFKIVLDKYWTAQVYVANYTDNNKQIKDCPITEIYLPNHPDQNQDILKFNFPLTISEDELLEQAGTPTDTSSYNDDDSNYNSTKYKYEKKSEKFYLNGGYSFEFTNGQLRYLTIQYVP